MALLQRFSFVLLFATLLSLVGCGGSSGGFDETPDGGDGTTPDAITISLVISDKDVAQATPAVLTATVMQGTTPLSGKLVTFSIDNINLASFETDVSTSSTNSSGVAVITLLAGSSSGSGIITATCNVTANLSRKVYDDFNEKKQQTKLHRGLTFTDGSGCRISCREY